jgi:hypothetical protein
LAGAAVLSVVFPWALLLFAATLLSTPVTSTDGTKMPTLPLLEAIVFDTEKLLDVLGAILIPLVKFRMTQF